MKIKKYQNTPGPLPEYSGGNIKPTTVSASLPKEKYAQLVSEGKMQLKDVPRKYQSWVEGEIILKPKVTEAINKAGKTVALAGTTVATLPTLIGATAVTPIATTTGFIGGMAGGAITNAATNTFSDGKYNTWGQWLGDKTGLDQDIMEMTNPGALIGGVSGYSLGARYRPYYNYSKWYQLPKRNVGREISKIKAPFLAEGSESTVYYNPGDKMVSKVMDNGIAPMSLEELTVFNKKMVTNRNMVPQSVPIRVAGYIKSNTPDKYYPVYKQKYIQGNNDDLMVRGWNPIEAEIDDIMINAGWKKDGGSYIHSSGKTAYDFNEFNVRRDKDGKLQFIDIDVQKQGGTLPRLKWK